LSSCPSRSSEQQPTEPAVSSLLNKASGWKDLPFYPDLNDRYSRDDHGILPDGAKIPAFNVFTRRDGTIRHFWSGEMTGDSADPGQDPRGAPDFAHLWNVLDTTPEGRGTD
jgi:predicted dithiol-disulfide oxidoreductase (DUF899 family)